MKQIPTRIIVCLAMLATFASCRPSDAVDPVATDPKPTEPTPPVPTPTAEMIVWTPGVGVERIAAPAEAGFIAPSAINDRGEIVGYYAVSELSRTHRGFFWSASTGYIEIVASIPFERIYAVDINNDGVVAGTALGSDGKSLGFVWSRERGFSGLVATPETEMMAVKINSAGDVTGTRSGRPFLWTASKGFVQFAGAGESEDGPNWPAYGIALNDQGHVLASWSPGYSPNIDYTWLPWSAPTIWKDGIKSDLGCKDCIATAMNNRGVVVGQRWGWSAAFMWTAQTGVEKLQTAGGTSVAHAVNDAGTIVGTVMTWNGKTIRRAAAWTPAGVVLIDDLSGVTQTVASDINAAGQVLVSVKR